MNKIKTFLMKAFSKIADPVKKIFKKKAKEKVKDVVLKDKKKEEESSPKLERPDDESHNKPKGKVDNRKPITRYEANKANANNLTGSWTELNMNPNPIAKSLTTIIQRYVPQDLKRAISVAIGVHGNANYMVSWAESLGSTPIAMMSFFDSDDGAPTNTITGDVSWDSCAQLKKSLDIWPGDSKVSGMTQQQYAQLLNKLGVINIISTDYEKFQTPEQSGLE